MTDNVKTTFKMALSDVLSAAEYLYFFPYGKNTTPIRLDRYFFNDKKLDGIERDDRSVVFVTLESKTTLLAFDAKTVVEISEHYNRETKFKISTLGGTEYAVMVRNEFNDPFTKEDLKNYWEDTGESDPHNNQDEGK